MRLETTAGCRRTPEVVMALEELALPYALHRVADGHFTQTFGRMGPYLVDGDFSLFEPGAMLRHLVRREPGHEKSPRAGAEVCEMDQWLDFNVSQLRAGSARVARLRMSGRGDDPLVAQETRGVLEALAVLERRLRSCEWLLGRFTVLDCAFSSLGLLPMIGIDLEPFEAVAAYRTRLLERPSWAKAMES